MAFGGFSDNQHSAPMAEINVTPMVDVMLVLLVIFIITAPLFTHAIKLDLPTAAAAPSPEKPESITVSIDGQGQIYWEKDAVTEAQLSDRMKEAGQKKPQPELQLRADKATRYEILAKVMSTAQTSGLTKLGFVTEPPAGSTAAPAASVPVAPGAPSAPSAPAATPAVSAPAKK